jgi:hypothetical protein
LTEGTTLNFANSGADGKRRVIHLSMTAVMTFPDAASTMTV